MLQVRNLHYSIGDRDLLSSVDWNLQPEKRFALVGHNGSGKTTLLRILAGEIEHDNTTFKVHQPQLESWDGVLLQAYVAIEVKVAGSDNPSYGAALVSARTQNFRSGAYRSAGRGARRGRR